MTTTADVLPSQFHELVVQHLYARASAIAKYYHARSLEEAWDWLAQQGFGGGAA